MISPSGTLMLFNRSCEHGTVYMVDLMYRGLQLPKQFKHRACIVLMKPIILHNRCSGMVILDLVLIIAYFICIYNYIPYCYELEHHKL